MEQNPYRTDFPGAAPFYGREHELERLCQAMEAGRRSLAAVMGGRGMGKTSFALRLAELLGRADGHLVCQITPEAKAEPEAFLAQLGQELGADFQTGLVTASIVDVVSALNVRRVTLFIDEVERLLTTARGVALLENLRTVWEKLHGKLGIIVLGGSKLRELLLGDASPFLRSAQWIPLRGLARDAVASLLREPCDLTIPDEIVEVLWEQTGGHPLLLQAIMEHVVESGRPVIEALPDAIRDTRERTLQATVFPIWWENLRERGQGIYRSLLAREAPVLHDDYGRVFGRTSHEWVEVLETTGVARIEEHELLPRCELFRDWMERHHPVPAEESSARAGEPHLTRVEALAAISSDLMSELESTVVTATARWARDLVEYPTLALKSGAAAGNNRLLPEQHFQLTLLMALRQRDLLVEAESLSSQRGRSDLKIRWPNEPDQRACTEVKLWGRPGHKSVIGQLLGYALPDDDFGCIVMLDRCARPLREAYEQQALDADSSATTMRWASTADAPEYPMLLTEHSRDIGRSLRIYHFLIQLPPD